MLKTWLQSTLLQINDYAFKGENLVLSLLVTFVIIVAFLWTRKWLKRYSKRHDLTSETLLSIQRLIHINFFLAWLILLVLALSVDHTFNSLGNVDIKISNLLILLLIMLIAKMADIIISARIVEEMIHRPEHDGLSDSFKEKDKKSQITRVIQYSLVTVVLIIILPLFDLDFVIHTITINKQEISIKLTSLLSAILVLLIARIVVWLFVNLVLHGWYQTQRIDHGKQYAYNQLVSYVIYTFAFIFALQYIGFNLTLLWAGTAALLVGVGIALQQTISDFFSGLVMLFERSVEAGDFLDFGTFQGTIKKIGLRASIVETLERKDIIIPNSKLVNDNVINWTRSKPTTRFEVLVGVAYGSDVELVKTLLLQIALDVNEVLLAPKPFVRFLNFGAYSLDFGLYFYSMNVTAIEDIKSDIRFRINQVFQENKVEIPFPQHVLWYGDKDK